MRKRCSLLLLMSLLWTGTSFLAGTSAFSPVQCSVAALDRRKVAAASSSSSGSLFYSNRDKNDNNENDDYFDTDTLYDRLEHLRVENLEQEFRRPPNPKLGPVEFVTECLHGLYNNGDPLPDSGFRLLLRASTKLWRSKLYQSVGAPVPDESTVDEEVVASALGEALGRPHNQFGILVGGEGEDGEEKKKYTATFPSDPLEYESTCWVECQLRGVQDNKLLAITGWQLERRDTDNAWLIDGIDWQDFRDEFRPGIGREEWMRICG